MSGKPAPDVSIDILCVGDEILAGATTNTNAGTIARVLQPLGLTVRRITEVGDVAADIQAALESAMQQSPVILVTGGLGPTPDDHTKEDIAAWFGDPLERDEQVFEAMRQRFVERGLEMPAVNEKQAWIPQSARAIANPLGSAPGVHWCRDGCEIFLMPGVPSEMEAMLHASVVPRLLEVFPGVTTKQTAVFRTTAIGESSLLERIQPVMVASTALHWAFYPSWHGVDVRISGAPAGKQFEQAWEQAHTGIRDVLYEYLYSEDPQESLAARVGQLLLQRGATLATAESCTGGLVGKLVTDVPGSSAWFQGGFVTYSNALKQELLKVPAGLLEEHGAVSAAVAAAMATGCRERIDASYAVAVTGVAGPTGGTPDKPVGLVYIALATPEQVRVRRWQFGKRRAFNREIASQRALDMVRRHLCGLPTGDLVGDS